MKKLLILLSFFLLFSIAIFIGSRVLNSPGIPSYPLKEVHIVPIRYIKGLTEEREAQLTQSEIEGTKRVQDVKFLEEVLKEEFPNVNIIIDDPLADPREASDAERGQYDAKIILQLLERKYNNTEIHVIAITDEDLFSEGLNFVYSSLNKKKNIGVLSTRQLRQKIVDGKVVGWADSSLKKERVRKLVLRMIGLMGGLKPRFSGDEQCVMRFSNNLTELDNKGTVWCGNEEEIILKFKEL